MKKIFMAMFLAALVPSTAIAHDFKTPLQDGVLAQFDGIIINGQNVNEAYESTKQQMVAAAKVKLDANDAKFNVVVREYNAKYEQENKEMAINSDYTCRSLRNDLRLHGRSLRS